MRTATIGFTIALLITVTIAFAMSGTFMSPKGGDLDPVDFKEQIEQKPGVVIDVRTRQEYEEGHLAETDQLIDFLSGDFDEKVSGLDKDQVYYLYCRTGNRSGKAMKKMQKAGFKEVYNVGGYEDLVSVGFEPEY